MEIFDAILINPMLNFLVLLYGISFNNFGLSIIIFTVIVRLVTLPLQLKQTRQMKAMTALQPRMKEIQARHKDPQERREATMRIYREAGVNPLGCLGPMVILMVIWIGLYRALIKSLGTNPDDLVGLSQRLYSWSPLSDPLNSNFFGMDLANPDPSPLIMPVLVGVSTWAQQKMTMMPSVDPKQASTQNMMLWMMPLFLGFITLSFPSGLALYWVVSNSIGVAIQGFSTRDWTPLIPKFTRTAPVPEPAPQPARESEPKEIESDGRTRMDDDVRKEPRRSNRGGPQRARRKSGGSRNRRNKPR